MREKQIQQNNKGQAIITAVVFFMIISLIMIVGIMTPLLRHLKSSHEFVRSRQSYYVAESLNEDAIYRLNSNLNVPPIWALSLNGASATATILTTLDTKKIYTVGNFAFLSRAITTTVSEGVGAAFNYGVQAGGGGFVLSGSSVIKGNVYSNGNIIATNGAIITGSAIAASSSSIGGDDNPGGVLIGTSTIGIAWAHNVQGATVAGNLYCQSGSNNNQPCNISKGDAPIVGMPFTDDDVKSLKDQGSLGNTISNDYIVGSSRATIGPTKIIGNLVVNNGGTLTLSGTVYVTGNIIVEGGGKIKLASSYGNGSGVLVSDGYVSLSGGESLSGSGQLGSFLFLLTTSDCPVGPLCGGNNAVSINGGAGAVILIAQNGVMSLNGAVNVKQVTAYKIMASGGTTVTYDGGLANVNFSNGPSGAWNVQSWSESSQ
ncbi:MAG: hypothetical protein WCI52_03290 [bacterium]